MSRHGAPEKLSASIDLHFLKSVMESFGIDSNNEVTIVQQLEEEGSYGCFKSVFREKVIYRADAT